MNTKTQSCQFDFPRQWQIVGFDQAFEDVTGGNSKVKSDGFLPSGVLPIIDQGQRNIAGYTNDVTLACRAARPSIIFGDHTKIFKFVDFPFALGADGVKVLKPDERLNPRFAFHYLSQVSLPDDAGYSRHFKFLRRISVPVPAIEEQRRIAAILDKADSIRRKRQEAIALTEQLLRSTFLEMFGDIPARRSPWQWGFARAHVEMSSGRSAKEVLADQPTEYPIYGGNGVNGWATAPLYREFIVIVGRVGQQCGIVHMTESPCWVTDNAIVIRVTNVDVLDPVYLGEALNASPIRDVVSRLDLPFINQDMLRDQPIPIPPIGEQRKFSAFRRAVLCFQREQLRACDEAQNLFNALVQRAFNGYL